MIVPMLPITPVESTINITNVAQLERKWGISCDDIYVNPISRSPAIYNGKLYTSGAYVRLTAYDAQTGQMLWQFGNGTTWAPQPVVSEDGIVFYMEGSSGIYQLYAVDADSGDELWKAPLAFDLGISDTDLVTVDEANGLVYIVEDPWPPGDGDGKLFALDKQTGEIVWHKSKAMDDIAFKGDYVLLNEGKIFVAEEVDSHGPDHMLSINASSQGIKITFDRPPKYTEQYTLRQDPEYIEQYTLCNDRLLVGFSYEYLKPAKRLVAYDPNSPAIVWQKEFSEEITGTIACNMSGNIIYVPTDPYLYALNATTGEEVWKYMGYGAIYNPSIANGIVYFLSDNSMYAIDENTGEKLFSFPLGFKASETTQVAICDGMVYFSGSDGTCGLFALGT